MSEKTKKPGFGLKEAEVRSAEQGRQNDRKKHRKKLERSFRKDFLYYDIFSQLWGWDEYNGNSDPEKAIQRLRQAMQNQQDLDIRRKRPLNGDLQFQVGVAYLNGWLPCKNSLEEAWRWFRRSEKRGSPRGKMAIGYMHEKQLINHHDEIAMLSNYRSAVAEGYAPAQYRLAQYYQRQSNPNWDEIKNLLTDAAAQQYTPAKYLLAALYPETVHNMEYREIYGDEWAALAREQKESGTGLYASKEETKGDNNLVEKIHEGMAQILPIVPVVIENNEILKRQEIIMQVLQTRLSGLREEMMAAGEEFRKQLQEIHRLTEETAEYLNRISESEREEAEKFMSVLFKGDWRNQGRLCNASCDALVDAHVLMKAAGKLGIRNYSGIVINAVWALEHECRRRFYDAFDSYLASIGVEAWQRYARMNLNNHFFTLGSVQFIPNSSDFNAFSKETKLLSAAAESERNRLKFKTEGEMICKYRFPGTWDPKLGRNKTFVDMIIKLNDGYRKPAAHAEEVERKRAEECCNLLGISDANKEVNNITGALKALLWLTAPLE